MHDRFDRFRAFAWFVLGYNLLVIAWGAYVRATGSGAGCGSHWPLCNGEVIPRAESLETLIEFSHRATSGLDGLLVLALTLWAFRIAVPGHPVRRAAVGSLVFLVVEALLGAGLVLFGWVVDDASPERAWVMSAHLVNTFLLLAFLALTAHRARPDARRAAGGSGVTALSAAGLALLVLVGVTGAVAALGDTLFPAETFQEGLAQDLDPTAHVLVRLRVFHPAVAIVAGLGLLAAALALAARRPNSAVRGRVRTVLVLFAAQLAIGFVNLLLAAPIGLQLVHLVAADLVWIAWVLLAAEARAGTG